jgi:DNA-binding protein HU-beta
MRSARLKVDIGAVLRTRMNTGVCVVVLPCVELSWQATNPGQQGRHTVQPAEMGLGLSSIVVHNFTERRNNTMAKGITKTQLVRLMAEKLELTNKQTATFLEFLAETAVKETKKSGEFTIPGIGKLVKAERKARIGRNPQTGEAIKIKAKTVVKFRVAKVAKDTIAPPKK